MDHRQFDNLARSVATLTRTSSRRAVARKLATFSLAAALGSRIRLEEAEAHNALTACKKKSGKQKRKCIKKAKAHNATHRVPPPILIVDPPPPEDKSCTNGATACGGACVDTKNDPNHCGGCGQRCLEQAPATCGTTGQCVAGSCQRYEAGTICRNASCTGSIARSEARCDSSGSCPPSIEESCGLFKCNASGNACRDTCGSDDHCVNGNWCNGGVCQPKHGIGAVCSATTPNQCRSGFCVDGVCCDSACVAPDNAIRSCSSGTCAFACIEGYGDCNNDLDKDPSNGCESDLSTNENCGACGARCRPGPCGRPGLGGSWNCLNGQCVCDIPEL